MALDPRWTATMDALVKDPDASRYDKTIEAEVDDHKGTSDDQHRTLPVV